MKTLYGQNTFMKMGGGMSPWPSTLKSAPLHFTMGCHTNLLFMGKVDAVDNMLAMTSVTMVSMAI
jgi:hypothetical protein